MVWYANPDRLSLSLGTQSPCMRHFLSTTTPYMGLVLICFILSGCFANSPKSPFLNTQHPLHGMASWYGPSFHGNPTANGEPYDMWALTAAHRTLPFGTWVKVSKIETGKTVTVRINDRGPFMKGRIIDLSYAAARELAMIGEGTAEVELRIVGSHKTSNPTGDPPIHFWVQAEAFTTLREAMILQEQLSRKFDQVRVRTVNLPSGEWHRVQVGIFPSKKRAQTVADGLKNNFGGNPTILTSN